MLLAIDAMPRCFAGISLVCFDRFASVSACCILADGFTRWALARVGCLHHADEFLLGMDAQFPIDISYMRLGGAVGYVEIISDILSIPASYQHTEDLLLTLSQTEGVHYIIDFPLPECRLCGDSRFCQLRVSGIVVLEHGIARCAQDDYRASACDCLRQ